uniref:Uncharacterized protein n=1 Tax=Nelumbo nucifera TaxID=4432 RepID=A0A822ZQX2_NELNU|nr:TPA_asm: hypothetical protein HUJ06_017224 [Nelumbo nucifera]
MALDQNNAQMAISKSLGSNSLSSARSAPSRVGDNLELALVHQLLVQYCEENFIAPLGYKAIEGIPVQAVIWVIGAVVKFAEAIIRDGWLPPFELPSIVIGPTLNTLATVMSEIMNLPFDQISWFVLAQWLRTSGSFFSIQKEWAK